VLRVLPTRWIGHETDSRLRLSEALFEDEAFPERELAALVAAKVYYQLQEYDESMGFALGAGKLFDIHHSGEFEETILGESFCLDNRVVFTIPTSLLHPAFPLL